MHPVLSIVAALAPSHQCAPSVVPDTTVSIAKADALTVHVNTSRMPCAPHTPCAALTANLIVAHHHNGDLGVMQVNSANPAAVGPSVADAFDACGSMRAGSGTFSQAYHQALRAAVSMRS
jgi:type IV secretion system protein VirB1